MESELEAPELVEAVRALALASRGLERAAGELNLAQYRVMMLVASSPDRASRLAEKAQVSRPSLTGVIDALESKGFLERVIVQGDRRGVSLELTMAGRDALTTAERAMTNWLKGVAAGGVSADGDAAVIGLGALGRVLACSHGRCGHDVHRARASAGAGPKGTGAR